jgi:hypothetical protein
MVMIRLAAKLLAIFIALQAVSLGKPKRELINWIFKVLN